MEGLYVFLGIVLFMVVVAIVIVQRQYHIPRNLIKKVNGEVYVRLLTYNNYNVYLTKERYLECKDSSIYSINNVKDFILGELSKGEVKPKSNDLLATMSLSNNIMMVNIGLMPR